MKWLNEIRFKIVELLVGDTPYINKFEIIEGHPLNEKLAHVNGCKIGSRVTTYDGSKQVKVDKNGNIYLEDR